MQWSFVGSGNILLRSNTKYMYGRLVALALLGQGTHKEVEVLRKPWVVVARRRFGHLAIIEGEAVAVALVPCRRPDGRVEANLGQRVALPSSGGKLRYQQSELVSVLEIPFDIKGNTCRKNGLSGQLGTVIQTMYRFNCMFAAAEWQDSKVHE